MYWNELKKKTWIDWIKILVAIDITSAGVGLVLLQSNTHVFAHALDIVGLGFLSRVFFGLLYIFVAVLIFKRVFPQKLAEEEHIEAKRMDEEIVDTTNAVKKGAKNLAKKAAAFTEKAHEKIDTLIDRGEEIIEKGKKDAEEEIDKLIKD